VLPSPKSQLHAVGEFADVSVNAAAEPTQTKEGAVKLAVGGASNVSVLLASVPAPHAFDATRVTVYVLFAAYVCVGFCTVEVLPSPKSQPQAVGVFVEASVKDTVSDPLHVFENVKSLAGVGETSTLALAGLLPQAFEAVSVTVYAPAAPYV
jgi:hypothetical protein